MPELAQFVNYKQSLKPGAIIIQKHHNITYKTSQRQIMMNIVGDKDELVKRQIGRVQSAQ